MIPMADDYDMMTQYFTVHGFAQKMSVTERTVYRWIKLGAVKAIQLVSGGEYRIPLSEFVRLQPKPNNV